MQEPGSTWFGASVSISAPAASWPGCNPIACLLGSTLFFRFLTPRIHTIGVRGSSKSAPRTRQSRFSSAEAAIVAACSPSRAVLTLGVLAALPDLEARLQHAVERGKALADHVAPLLPDRVGQKAGVGDLLANTVEALLDPLVEAVRALWQARRADALFAQLEDALREARKVLR
jgi:hypothetical protein